MITPPVLKTGAVAAVFGAVAALGGNAARPLPLGLGTRGVLRQVAATPHWELIHLVLIGSILLFSVGLAVAAGLMVKETTGWLASLGLITLVLGSPVAVTATAVDGFARGELARAWVQAPFEQQNQAFLIAQSIDSLWYSMFIAWLLLLLGITPILVGLAQTLSEFYPNWLGILGACNGAAVTSIAVYLVLVGSTDAAYIATAVLVTLVALWMLSNGVVMWKRAGEIDVATQPSTDR